MNEYPQSDQTVAEAPAAAALDAGLAAAFGPDSGPPLPAAGSVLQALAAVLPSVPSVHLRDPDSGASSPIVRPQSEQMPARHDTGRYHLAGEIARGGMGAILKGRDPDLAGLRQPDAIATLPAAEQQACRQLWADVADLLKRAQGKD